jgi:hypothetical protein
MAVMGISSFIIDYLVINFKTTIELLPQQLIVIFNVDNGPISITYKNVITERIFFAVIWLREQ